MPTSYIGLGANLHSAVGPPEATLAATVLRLESLGRLIARSSLYSTAPVGFADQPRFFNAVVALESELTPPALLSPNCSPLSTNSAATASAGLSQRPAHPRPRHPPLRLPPNLRSPTLEIPHPRLAEAVPSSLQYLSPKSRRTPSTQPQAAPWDNCSAACAPPPVTNPMPSFPFNLISGTPIPALLLASILLPLAASAQTPTPQPTPAQTQSASTPATPTPAQSAPSPAAPPQPQPPQAPTTTVTVTAYRTPLSELESPATTRLLDAQSLQSTAGPTLDDELRQIPGLELFRRSSSLVANPTSQGMSLRGLGSTSASRTLIIDDDVPLNDPLGGWIHWQELPALTIRQVELVRGGASDLYGSSAIGGVVNVVPLTPTTNAAQLRSSYGGEETWNDDLMAEAVHGPWGLLFGAGALGTDGYIQEAPFQRGPVDQPSNVHSQNGLLQADRKLGSLRLIVRGSGFNEDRNNGTPYQKNGTRLGRYATGADWNAPHQATFALRLYGADERYRQTFSSISNLPNFGVSTCAYRCGEIPTRFSQVPDNELGAAAHWSQPIGTGLVALAGADTHDLRIWDREQTYGATAALTNLHDHQRDSAIYGEALATHKAWTLTASARFDWFQNFDGQLLAFSGSAWSPYGQATHSAKLSRCAIPASASRANSPIIGLSRLRASVPSALQRRANSTARPRWGISSRCPTACSKASVPRDGKPGWPRSGAGVRFAEAISSPRSIARFPP